MNNISEKRSDSSRVHAAVVTYNKKKQLVLLLDRLRVLGIPATVTANACTDGTVEAVRNDYPEVRLVASSSNLGGTGGFNCSILAALETGSEYILLLDDDALPDMDCIEKLAGFLDTHLDYSFASPSVYISSRPDTLQETGGSVNFMKHLPIEAYNRFRKKENAAELPEIIDIDYASACCLLVRSSSVRKAGILDWNYFIFSDDVDFCLRLGKLCGRGACVTGAVVFHDFPWAKPFSPMRLYFFHRNNLYFLSKNAGGAGKILSLYISLARLVKDIFISSVSGDREHCGILVSALNDAVKGKYGAWKKPAVFPDKRKKLDSIWFRKNRIKKILIDLSVNDFASDIIDSIKKLSFYELYESGHESDYRLTIDFMVEDPASFQIDGLAKTWRNKNIQIRDTQILRNEESKEYAAMKKDAQRSSCTFCEDIKIKGADRIHKRGIGRKGFIYSFFDMKKKGYDLVVTDAAMTSRRITSMTGRFSAFFHNGELFEAENRPFFSFSAFIAAHLAGLAGASLLLWRFLKRPDPGKIPDDAAQVLSGNGINPLKPHSLTSESEIAEILNSGSQIFPGIKPAVYDRIMGRLVPAAKYATIRFSDLTGIIPPDVFLMPGPGEAASGFAEWCRMREKTAPLIYGNVHSDITPLFSVIVPVCDPEPLWIHSCIQSVKKQTFKGWELILVDDASKNERIKRILEKYRNSDIRIKVLFNEKRSGISETTNRAAENANSPYLFFLDHDDILDRFCLAAFARKINEADKNSPFSVIYAAEDRFGRSMRRTQPGFKPDYSPDLLLGTNYMHHPVAIRADIFQKAGRLRKEYDGSQDHDLLLRAVEIDGNVAHIPDILYHMRIHPRSLAHGPSAKPKAHGIDRDIIKEALKRRGVEAEITDTENGFPGYSRIIRKCSNKPSSSIILSARYDNSQPEKWLNASQIIHIQNNLSLPADFNRATEKASGDVLIFADSDLYPVSNWSDILLPHLVREGIGVVTGKIIYRDGTLFSCGLSAGFGGIFGRWHNGLDASGPGYGGWMSLDHEVLAAPWRFLAIRKELFHECGGFDENYIKEGFDADLCLRIVEKGLRNIVAPGCTIKFEKDIEKIPHEKWPESDIHIFMKKWGKIISKSDPYLNPNYTRSGKISGAGIEMAGFSEMSERYRMLLSH